MYFEHRAQQQRAHERTITARKKFFKVLGVRTISITLLFVFTSPTATQASDVITGNQVVFRDTLSDGRPCSFCPQLTLIAGGRFFMGSLPGEGHSDEHGPHNLPFVVHIEDHMAVSVSTVTRREYAAFIASNPRASRHCAGMIDGVFRHDLDLGWRDPGYDQRENHPVVCVTWHDAKAYAQWLSQQTGKAYRLLTEAEWEYVARAGTRTRYWWGEDILPGHVNCLANCSDDFVHTAPADAFRGNPFGLFNLLGNVWEWVEDCYEADAYKKYSRIYPNPVSGPDSCKRVIRGGSWQENPWSLRAANREGWKADTPLNDIGFRVARIGPDIPI